ncbi:ribosome biogenesis factor YjgA [Oligella urethralis]|uniref:ribosome biogenesis factor YjgA n=1 Tax=Oligella urethralis TaxID=90245 RepID=UPI0027B8C1AE|nr:ribosome biogenesis factor YjgA [Oligella urethralis]
MTIESEHNNDPSFDDNGYDGPSKSQVKRQLHAIVDLTKELIELSVDRIRQLPLEEEMTRALEQAKSFKSHGAKRRQTHYAAKLLRQADLETIKTLLHTWKHGSKEQNDHFHRLELMRERLIESDEEVTKFIEQYPQLDIQALRSVVRAARKEQAQNAQLSEHQTPQRKQYRALFQFLKDVIE